MTFRMIVQLWNTNTSVILSRDVDLTETWCIFQQIWEWEFMYFAGKLVYLIVPPIGQFAIIIISNKFTSSGTCIIIVITV